MSEARELAMLIADELRRQADADLYSVGYVGVSEGEAYSGYEDVTLDGHFDLVELAQRILDGQGTALIPGVITDVPAGAPVLWTEYLHKDWMLNANQRLHHRPKNDRVQAVKTMGKARHRNLGKYTRAKLDIVVLYPTRRGADVHNYMPTAKAYVDGLIDIPDTAKGMKKQPARGIMADDSDAYLAGPFLHPALGSVSDRKDHFQLNCILQPMK